MLGLSAQRTEYRTIYDFHSPADYLEYMFSGLQGVLYRAVIDPKYYQNYYRASGLIKAQYNDVRNCYISMNSFYRTSELDEQCGRDVLHLKRLNAFYVDIDCYNAGLTKQEVLMRLDEDFVGKRIPVPTFIVDSGRGIYLIWKLRNEDKNALSRWMAVEQYLTDTLEELGADQACTDAARILRVPFSLNTKSDSQVSIIEFNDLTYSIYDIAKEFDISSNVKRVAKRKSDSGERKYPYNHATERQMKYVADIAKAMELSEDDYPDFTDFHATDNWIKVHKSVQGSCKAEKKRCNENGNIRSSQGSVSIRRVFDTYCKEIKKLFSMRKGADCKRELGLFLYRYFCLEITHDREETLKKTLAFNASLDCPFDDAYVTKVTASAESRVNKGIPYAYRKSTIISVLEITEEELKELPFLASDVKSQKEYRRENNRKNYEKRLAAEGKTAKKDLILERRAAILTLQKQGKSAAEIQKDLHISRATYHRDIAALAVASVLEAVRSLLAAQAEKVANTAKKAIKTVSKAVKSVRNKAVRAVGRVALLSRRKALHKRLSHFFSMPFIEMYSFAVPHSHIRYSSTLIEWITCRKGGDRTSNPDNSDGTDDG